MATLKVVHNAGFFSCFSGRLAALVDYFSKFGCLPEYCDSSSVFIHYKSSQDLSDITSVFLSPPDRIHPVVEEKFFTPYTGDDIIDLQFTPYRNINLKFLSQITRSWFKPSEVVRRFSLRTKLRANFDASNSCVIFYRGLAKEDETVLGDYQEYYDRALSIKAQHPKTVFYVVSDESEFINFAGSPPISAIPLEPELPHISKQVGHIVKDVERALPDYDRFIHALRFFGVVLLMAESRHLITYSGNAAFWVYLYRERSEFLSQFLVQKEYIFGIQNKFFTSNTETKWV
jgi:hypothetical protein